MYQIGMATHEIDAWNRKLWDIFAAVIPIAKKNGCRYIEEITNEGGVNIYNDTTAMALGFAINQNSAKEGFGSSVFALKGDDVLGAVIKDATLPASAPTQDMIALVKGHLKHIGCL